MVCFSERVQVTVGMAQWPGDFRTQLEIPFPLEPRGQRLLLPAPVCGGTPGAGSHGSPHALVSRVSLGFTIQMQPQQRKSREPQWPEPPTLAHAVSRDTQCGPGPQANKHTFMWQDFHFPGAGSKGQTALGQVNSKVKVLVFPTLCDPVDCSPPGSSVRGILQARILKWVAISFSRGSSQLRSDQGIKPRSPALQAGSLPTEPPGEACLWRSTYNQE